MQYKKNTSLTDNIIELVSIVVLLITVVIPIIFYSNISEEVPIHYNIHGEPDAYADKFMVFIITALAIVTYVVFSILQRKLQIFNFPIPVTDQNREALYTLGLKLIIRIKLLIMVSFLYANVTSACFLDGYEDIVSWIFYSILALITIIPIYYIRKMYALK